MKGTLMYGNLNLYKSFRTNGEILESEQNNLFMSGTFKLWYDWNSFVHG